MAEAMVIGVIIFLCGVLCGRVLRVRSRPKAPKPVELICGCRHHHAMHDPKTGVCNMMVMQAGEPVREKDGTLARDFGRNVVFRTKPVPCGCRQYSGPVPIHGFAATEIAG